MMKESTAPGSIVVGIDGSRAATRAALWAIDEALSRDVPLRLLYAIERGDRVASEHAIAETTVGRVRGAIEDARRPVKIETEIAEGTPITSLTSASGSAAMVCVGAIGLRHFQVGRVGSTAAALAISGRCPVAIVRGH